MPEPQTTITIGEVRDYLSTMQGKIVTLKDTRDEFNILRGSKSWDVLRNHFFRLVEQKFLRPVTRRGGAYKVIEQVEPVPVFSVQRKRRPAFDLKFPRDYESGDEMDFADDVIIREGDLILVSGVSNYGKTTLCLNFCGENIDSHPVLMGNEYTSLVEENYVPTPRFLSRLDSMAEWVQWTDENGFDKFTLLPVRDDYAEHIVKNKINIIDWINIDTGEHYMIGTILENIKKALGRGIAIIALQKAEGSTAGRGGQFTKDFTDCELLIDRFGDREVLLTIGKVKESNHLVAGQTYAYQIAKGVKITDFREVQRCPGCHGQGYRTGKMCEMCKGKKYVDLHVDF